MNIEIDRLTPIDQRIDAVLAWLEDVKLNHRFPRPIYDGLQRTYWLLRDLKAEQEKGEPQPLRALVEDFIEWWHAHREGSPNAAYLRVDRFVKDAEALSHPESRER